jgi:hypothetical protein
LIYTYHPRHLKNLLIKKNKRRAIKTTAAIESGLPKLMVQPNDFKCLGGNIRLSFGLK